MLGLVVVPQPGDEEFLLEKPLQQLYIAEASQSKASSDTFWPTEPQSKWNHRFLAQEMWMVFKHVPQLVEFKCLFTEILQSVRNFRIETCYK